MYFPDNFFIYNMTRNYLCLNWEGNEKPWVDWPIVSALTPFHLIRNCLPLLSFSPLSKNKTKPLRRLPPGRTLDTTAQSVQASEKASATPSPSRKAALPTYFLRSAVPSGGLSREYSGAWGRGGRGESWAGSWEARLRALGALYIPLPKPPAALPTGNTDASKFPLPSILHRWRETNQDFLNHASIYAPN